MNSSITAQTLNWGRVAELSISDDGTGRDRQCASEVRVDIALWNPFQGRDTQRASVTGRMPLAEALALAYSIADRGFDRDGAEG